MYIAPELNTVIRKAAGESYAYPVVVSDTGNKPRSIGQYGGYYTKGGAKIAHPNAYAKTGWSNMEYHTATLAIHTPKFFVFDLVKNRISFEFAGVKIYFKSKIKARKAERIIYKYENDILAAPIEKRESLINAALSLIHNHILVVDFAFKSVLKSQAMLALGRSYKDICQELYGVELTHNEAKECFTDCGVCNVKNATLGLANKVKNNILRRYVFSHVHHTELIRWIIAIDNDQERLNCLLKERELTGPHGEKLKYHLISKLDEIQAVDLDFGVKTGVNRAFENCAKRTTEEKLKRLKIDKKILNNGPDWWPGDTEQRRLLVSAHDLIVEGEKMNNCVAQYAGYIKRGESIIFSITTFDSNSTVELDKAAHVRQHLGFGNSKPSQSCKDYLQKTLNDIDMKLKAQEI